MNRFMIAVLALLLGAFPAWAGIERQEMSFGGVARSYLLYVPDGLSPGPHPLVLVLHGGGGSAREVRRSTRGRFEALADRDGFLVLYPDAIGRIWDTGVGEISSRQEPHRDDLEFLLALIEQVSDAHAVDARRVFAAGISRGGQAAYMLGCRSGGVIRAVAAVSMTLPAAEAENCAAGGPLGFLLIEGTADPIVPYDGGRVTVFGRARDRVLSADQTMALFERRNGCRGETNLGRSGAVTRSAGRACRAPVMLDRVEGGGHGWPSGRNLPGLLVGATNGDMSGPDEIWAFFRGL